MELLLSSKATMYFVYNVLELHSVPNVQHCLNLSASFWIYFLLKPNTLVTVARDLLNLAQNFRLSELCLCFRWWSGLEITVLCPFSSLVPITQVSLANHGLKRTHESDGKVLSGARLLTQPLCWGNQKLVCVSLKYPCFWSHSEGLLPVVLVLLLWKTDL